MSSSAFPRGDIVFRDELILVLVEICFRPYCLSGRRLVGRDVQYNFETRASEGCRLCALGCWVDRALGGGVALDRPRTGITTVPWQVGGD